MSASETRANSTRATHGPKRPPSSDPRPFWAITCYFNPMGYDRRLRAYRRFREALGVPLVTVELGFDGRFDLGPDDADVFIPIRGRDVLWQKERMLNCALDGLPWSCEKVAWLDCDILFGRADWPDLAERALEANPLVQLFQRVHYLSAEWRAGEPLDDAILRTRFSLASGVSPESPVEVCLVHPSPKDRPGTYANGMAWAARRELLDEHRFFDASIIGGGDRAMSSAAYGCFEHVFAWHELNAKQRAYYLEWAKPFHEACQDRVGALEGDIYHQWHGDAADRGLDSRHAGLRRYEFDPYEDIALDASGSWRWSSAKPELHAYVKRYFASRREDG